MSVGADTRANTMGWCALERGHVALLEPLAQLGDAFVGVGAVAFIIEATELVPSQATTQERGVSMGVDTKANTGRGGALERGHGTALEPLAQLGDALGGVGAATEFIEATDIVVGQAAMGRVVSMGADTKANTRGGGGGSALDLGDHRLLEDGSEHGNALDSDEVAFETARDGQDGNGERVGVSMGPD